MRRLLAVLMLIVHVNVTMFIPVVEDVDIYDTSGQQVSDINTLFQLIEEVFLGQTHHSDTDQDDDQAHYFTASHHVHHYIVYKSVICETQPLPVVREQEVYRIVHDEDILSGICTIIGPPPKS